MAYQRVRDLVEHVRELHERTRRAVERARDREGGERAALLLDYLEEHERNVQQALESAAPTGDSAVLDTWLQFTPDVEVDKELQGFELESVEDLDDLVARVLKFEEALVHLYDLLEAHSSAPRVKSFFASLKELEDAARKRLARTQLESLEG